MKKTILILAVVFMSVSSSFAYQSYSQSMSANGFDYYGNGITGYNYMSVNINSFCDWMIFEGNVSSFHPDTYASYVAYDSANELIYEGSYSYGEDRSFSNGVLGNQYWGTVQAYMSIYHGYATTILRWGHY